MPPHQIRFVTACQQLLALGVVLAVLTPAASVISLDVVHDAPSATADGTLAAQLSAYTREAGRSSTVPDQVVDPAVTEVALTAPAGASARTRTAAAANVLRAGSDAVTSVAEPVEGYGAVGVTWQPGTRVPEDDIALQVRTRTDSTWSAWMDFEYHDDHGPDPGSAEAKHARPGTDALLVGDVDDVQVKVSTDEGALPADLRLAVVDPGEATRTAVEHPALDAGAGTAESTPDPTTPGSTTPGSVETDPGDGTAGSDQIDLQAATFTPKPQIYSRAQWGADERMRDKPSLHFFEVHAGFVHHTVNANDYSREQVPGIIRSIYAYHTKSRGWSDIGYNFLVDRFGRIWTGRAGGTAKAVRGAHTLGFNSSSTGIAVIGNFEEAEARQRVIKAIVHLSAWKLDAYGRKPAGNTRVRSLGSDKFASGRRVRLPVIDGHRDTNDTACPGEHLYAALPVIRARTQARVDRFER